MNLKNFTFDENSLNVLDKQGIPVKHKKSKKQNKDIEGPASSRSKNSKIARELNKQVYDKEMSKLENSKHRVRNDDEYIRNMDKFNKFIEQQKSFSAMMARDRIALQQKRGTLSSEGTSFIGDNESTYGLYHKNLNAIYGRVRSKYNKQIKQGGASIKFKSKIPKSRQQYELDPVNFAYLDSADPQLHAEITKMISQNPDPHFDDLKLKLGLISQ